MKNKMKNLLLMLAFGLHHVQYAADSMEMPELIEIDTLENEIDQTETIQMLQELGVIDFTNNNTSSANGSNNTSLMHQFEPIELTNTGESFNLEESRLEPLSPVEAAIEASNALEKAQEAFNNNPTQNNQKLLLDAQKAHESAADALDRYDDLLGNADPLALSIAATEIYNAAVQNYESNPSGANGLKLLDARDAMEYTSQQLMDFEYQKQYDLLYEKIRDAATKFENAEQQYNAGRNDATLLAYLDAEGVLQDASKAMQDLMNTEKSDFFEEADGLLGSSNEQNYDSINEIPVEPAANVATKNIQANMKSGMTAWEAFKEWVVNLFTNPILAQTSWKKLCEIINNVQPVIAKTIPDLQSTEISSVSTSESSVNDQEIMSAIQKLQNLGATNLPNSTETYTENDLTQALSDAKVTRSSEFRDYYDSYQILRKGLDLRIAAPILS